MEQLAERLSEKIQTLTRAQLIEVERFVQSIEAQDHDRDLTRVWSQISEPSFAAVWNNPEDDVYDAL